MRLRTRDERFEVKVFTLPSAFGGSEELIGLFCDGSDVPAAVLTADEAKDVADELSVLALAVSPPSKPST